MRRDLFKGAILGAVASTVVLAATAAFAGTGIGKVFNLGETNAVNAESTLQGDATGANLQLVQKGSGAGLAIVVPGGKAPITVNASAGKARNLDADKLDGQDSSSFVQGGGAVFTAHKTISTSTLANVVAVPGVGTLKASWDGGTLRFSLLNGTGQTVDVTSEESDGTSDGMPVANKGEIMEFSQFTLNEELEVQIAWGSHFVRLAISWFVQEAPGPRILVFGYAR